MFILGATLTVIKPDLMDLLLEKYIEGANFIQDSLFGSCTGMLFSVG